MNIRIVLLALCLMGCQSLPAPRSDFSIGSSDAATAAGGVATTLVVVSPLAGFAEEVVLSVASLPEGISVAFDPPNVKTMSVVTFSVNSSARAGNFPVTVVGRSGSLTRTTSLTLTVISAIGGVTPLPPTPAPQFSLALSAGTINGGSSIGTFLAYMLRDNSGLPPLIPHSISVRGPDGWNQNQTLVLNRASAGPVEALLLDDLPAISGTYTVQVSIAGQTVTQSAALDAVQRLDLPLSLTINSASANLIDVAWRPLAGLRSYLATVSRDSEQVFSSSYITANSFSVRPGNPFDVTASYTLSLYSFSENLAVMPSSLPPQINVSKRETAINFTPPSPSSGTYNILLRVDGTLTPSQQSAFDQAVQRWQRIITQGFPAIANISIPANACNAGFPAFSGTIKDVLIDVRITAIDGPGGIAGQAGPCTWRTSNYLTLYGIMEFDRADTESLERANMLDEVILHEMGHVLGFGSLWDVNRSLLVGGGTGRQCGTSPVFVGVNAVREWQALGGSGSVPVEGNTSGPGSCDSHWRESVFGTELMTPFITIGRANPISRLTIAAMEDLGYTVDYAAADPYSLSTGAEVQSATPTRSLNITPIRPQGGYPDQ